MQLASLAASAARRFVDGFDAATLVQFGAEFSISFAPCPSDYLGFFSRWRVRRRLSRR